MYKKRTFLLGALLVFLGALSASADTIPGGDVSGTWYQANSPYYITGNITIPSGDTLTIEPGVEVSFQGNYSLTVNGYLEALGTEADSIHFTASTTWTGIYFTNAPDSSHMIYCNVSDFVWAGITFQNSNPVISHSTVSGEGTGLWVNNPSGPSLSYCDISYNSRGILWSSGASRIIANCIISHNDYSGGIFLNSGHLTFVACDISDNTNVNNRGGGICSNYGTLTFINCTISNNTAENDCGGGVACRYGGPATFTNCTINGNFAVDLAGSPYLGGGGISLNAVNATLSYCTIFDNSAAPDGGGIAIHNSGNLSVDHCTIESNQTFGSQNGSGIYVGSDCAAGVTNSIISNNYSDYGISNFGTLTVDYTNFFNNDPGPISGNIPPGFGVIDTINANGDSCDVYYNTFLDPLFVDYANADYHLQASSPCIDAGDPNSPLDPDSSISDMGTFYYHYLRGDANKDKKVTIADIVYLVSYLFKHGPAPAPFQSGEANCDGKVTVADVVYLVAYLFKHGPQPAC